jgi:hypothetical protein
MPGETCGIWVQLQCCHATRGSPTRCSAALRNQAYCATSTGSRWLLRPSADMRVGIIGCGVQVRAQLSGPEPEAATAHLQHALQGVLLCTKKVCLPLSIVGSNAQCVNVSTCTGAISSYVWHICLLQVEVYLQPAVHLQHGNLLLQLHMRLLVLRYLWVKPLDRSNGNLGC